MTVSLYQQYLAADFLQKRFAALGLEHDGISLGHERWTGPRAFVSEEDPTYSFMHDVSASVYGLYGADEVEAVAGRWIEAFPDSEIVRHNGYIYLRGRTGAAELSWHVSFGRGVCEQVQVGTRKVMRPAPDAPMVEVEEPVYEVRCVDPLAEAVAS